MRNTLKTFLELDNINEKTPNEINIILGTIYEYSRELNTLQDLERGIKISSMIILDTFTDDDKMTFYYNLSNAWSYKKMMIQNLNSPQFWEFENEELVQEILNCRKALFHSKDTKNISRKCEVLTNLGNDLSHLGRFSEAIDAWQRVLSIKKDFPMAIGNLGFGLFHYAQILYDDSHKAYFLKESYNYLKKAIMSNDIYPEAKMSFSQIVSWIEQKVDNTFLNSENIFDNYSLGESLEEKNYRKWCINNSLFLNPLNDIINDDIVAQDILCLPTIIVKKADLEIYNYHSFFNQIKQEFCSARYLFYDSITNQEPHFSDRENAIIDILDYSTYSYNLEKSKIAFRTFYSILDKIAYLINTYLKLGFESREVNYRKIWYVKGKPNPIIMESQNWALRGLFWLYKDFFEKEDLHSFLEPEAKELSTIRNFIEHKSFKIVEFENSRTPKDNFTYVIDRNDFIDKTFKLMKTIRAAIMYTSLFINIEEGKKEYNSNELGNMQLFTLDDQFKK